MVYSKIMIIEQIVEIPASRQLILDLPPNIPTGKAKAAIEFTFSKENEENVRSASAMEKLLNCCSNKAYSLDAYLERHWSDNDHERSIELNKKRDF